MKSSNMTSSEAIEVLDKAVPKGVYPNEGFLEQLKMYQEMGNKIDRDSQILKQFLLKKFAGMK